MLFLHHATELGEPALLQLALVRTVASHDGPDGNHQLYAE